MKKMLGFSPAAKKQTIASAARGFTLVELAVVMAIIAILAALAIPAYTNYTTKAKFTEVVTATSPTKTAIATCATTGDCVSANTINLSAPVPQVVIATGTSTPFPSNGSTPPGTKWIECGTENGGCAFAGTYTVLYGTQTSNVQQTLGNGATCANGVFGDPAYGFLKTCWVAIPLTLLPASMGGTALGLMPIPCVASSGANGCAPSTKYAASVSYDQTGVITATATNSSGLKAETFVLTPSYSGGRVDWAASGSCKTRLGGPLC